MTTSVQRILVVAVAAAAAIVAIASAGASTGDAGNQLGGTWKVAVNRPAPLSPLSSLQVFTSEGSVIEAANDSAARSASYGSWERIEGRLYASTGIFFRFDAQTGAWLGTQKIDRTIRLSEDGQTFAAIARATAYDTAGNVIASFRVPSTGQRLGVDRIPDVP
jgi:hypothetical protein